jgi:hypothetical protein
MKKTSIIGKILGTALAAASVLSAAAQNAPPPTAAPLYSNIQNEKSLPTVEQNYTNLLQQYTNSPQVTAEIHAAMAQRYMTDPSRPYAKIIAQCQLALQGPLDARRTSELWRLLGQAYKGQMNQATSLNMPALRRQALTAYLNARNAATGRTPAALQMIDRDVAALYRESPYTDEILSVGTNLIADASVLQNLVQMAQAGSAVTRTPVAIAPPPAGFHFDAPEYEVDGVIETTAFGAYPGVTRSDFKVFVKGPAWYIETADTEQSMIGLRREIHRVGTMDGTSIVSIVSFVDPIKTSTNSVLDPNAVPVSSGSIYTNGRPGGERVVSRLWLMFASQYWFKGATTNQLVPVYDPGSAMRGDPNYQQDAEWTLMSGQTALPWEVVFYSDGTIRRVQVNGMSATPYPAPYSQGYTNAIGYMNGVTNFNGVAFPAGFVFEEYEPAGGLSRFNLQVHRHTEAVVTAFTPVCSRQNLLPDAAGVTLVNDWRGATGQPPRPLLARHRAGDVWQ